MKSMPNKKILFIPPYIIAFGDSSTGFAPHSLSSIHDEQQLREKAPYGSLLNKLSAQHFCILKQTHSAIGLAVSPENLIAPYTREGDFLITNAPGIALGVATADCAPVIIMSKKDPALAVIHAGWRGAANGIIEHALSLLSTEYRISPAECHVIVGPATRACCYEVQEDFPLWGNIGSILRDNKRFFDLPIYIADQCATFGVPHAQIELGYAECTICSPQYCSFRRDGEKACRQITCAVIKPRSES